MFDISVVFISAVTSIAKYQFPVNVSDSESAVTITYILDEAPYILVCSIF
jgi:hypothetical protein